MHVCKCVFYEGFCANLDECVLRRKLVSSRLTWIDLFLRHHLNIVRGLIGASTVSLCYHLLQARRLLIHIRR